MFTVSHKHTHIMSEVSSSLGGGGRGRESNQFVLLVACSVVMREVTGRGGGVVLSMLGPCTCTALVKCVISYVVTNQQHGSSACYSNHL